MSSFPARKARFELSSFWEMLSPCPMSINKPSNGVTGGVFVGPLIS